MGLDVRVDWDGDSNSLGTFEVRAKDGQWVALNNLDSADPANDLMYACDEVDGNVFRIRIQRSPHNPRRAIRAKAIPITWKSGREPVVLADDPEYVAFHGTDFARQADSAEVAWQDSILDNGVHTVVLELTMKQFDGKRIDYALLITLQHPSEDDTWVIQDPIVRPPSGEG